MTRSRDVANIDGILTTTGDTYYASAAATPARLGIGSTGQVMTVAGGVPSWATAAAGGGMTLLSTTAITSVASISITSINQTYKNLIVQVDNAGIVSAGNATYLKINGVSTGHGYNTVGAQVGSGSPGVTKILLAPGLNSTSGWCCKIELQRYATTTGSKLVDYKSVFVENSSNNLVGLMGAGLQTATTAISSITIETNGGNFVAQGNIFIYGVN